MCFGEELPIEKTDREFDQTNARDTKEKERKLNLKLLNSESNRQMNANRRPMPLYH